MTTTTVTERDLVRRINRKLDKLPFPQRVGVLAERSRGYYNLGRFHVFDVYRNALLYSHIDLVQWARELGVLAAGAVGGELTTRPIPATGRSTSDEGADW